jgi:tetratricopeptide (TPR) repeat protein
MHVCGVVALAVLAFPAAGAEWEADIRDAQKALASRDFNAAGEKYRSALQKAESEKDQSAGMLQALRGLATVSRLQGNLPESAQFLNRAIRPTRQTAGEASLELADLVSELASVYRGYGARDLSIGTFISAIAIREQHPDTGRENLARDQTILGILQIAAEDHASATETLTRALATWDSAVSPDDVRILPVLDALGGIYRDSAEYSKAEPLYLRALAMREMAAGTDSADLIGTLDSLSYVYFGQKKFAEAEPFYKRLLATWEASAGREHPMVALTLEKLGVFYAAQDKYADAEPLFERSIAIRAAALLQSVNHKGRSQLMQNKPKEAEEVYRAAIAMGDSFKLRDELLDPVLRVYERILRDTGKPREAKLIDERIRAALIRKADRSGTRKPLPPPAPGPVKN